jgi:hypothetical protein
LLLVRVGRPVRCGWGNVDHPLSQRDARMLVTCEQ